MSNEQVPLPSRLELAPSNFVGRSEELQLLDEAWARVCAGPTREIVLVAGEAGLGKTTLVSRAARKAFDRAVDRYHARERRGR